MSSIITEKMKLKTCPKCKSENITLSMGGVFGKWECKDCDYLGPIVVEQDKE